MLKRVKILSEILDLYTKDRIKTGKTMIRGKKQPKGYYRTIIHVCIFNSKNQMLVQQRQSSKSYANLWDLSAGGSVISGETSSQAAHRELFEELGLSISFEAIRPALTIHTDTNFKGFDDVYLIEREIDPLKLKLQAEEVKAVMWANLDKIIEMINNGIFAPYNENYIKLLFFMKDFKGTKYD